MRIGSGYDVHKLVEGRDCIIGGVNIPYEKGLLGHSDADVLLHAISDALLGAAAMGDIGKHFPDTDPQFKGADSRKLLSRVLHLISEKGYGQAVNDTNSKMLKDIQKGIRSQFMSFLQTGTGEATGVGLQAAMAQVWGKLQILFEDTAVETVYFMNPLDVADYLGSAQISTQTAFGMSYIQNFLGMGTAILCSDVPKGKILATASENVVLYYIPVTSADMAQAFALTSDATGLIGIHTGPTYDNLSAETVAASGVGLFAEKLDGIVVGTISAAA